MCDDTRCVALERPVVATESNWTIDASFFGQRPSRIGPSLRSPAMKSRENARAWAHALGFTRAPPSGITKRIGA